jgi:2-dehydro-3-deoxyphosphogluconate aldolase/(4S)-4-hydroxy-2-oxoglutarate aldolase
MVTMTLDLAAELARTRLLAVIRGTDTEAAIAAGTALLTEGVTVVEVALTTPGALDAIEALREVAPPGCLVGAGTVLTTADVVEVTAAGAQFVVTPAVVESIAEAARRGLPVAAGALTPTEAYTAVRQGASVVKLFPAGVGGPGYLRALRDPLPNIPFVAVGGVGLAEVPGYLAAGAIAVGVGGPLVGDAASGGDLAALRARAREYLGVVAR